MRKSKVSFLTEYADQSDEFVAETEEVTEEADAEEAFVIPEDLSTLSTEELQTLHKEASSHFDSVYANVGSPDFTADDVQALSDLTAGIEALQTALDERAAAAEELAAQARELAARVKGEEPEAPVETEEAPVEEVVAIEAQPVVAAAAPAPAQTGLRIPLSRVRTRHVPKPYSGETEKLTMGDLVQASGEGAGFAPGQGLDWDGIGKIVDHRLSMYNGRQYAAAHKAGRQMRQTFAVATVRKPIDPDLVITSNDPMHVESVLRKAMQESRLPQGSLVASGGWCAPSEILYDLCELESRDGIFSLPEVGVARGGIQRTLGPNFADIYGNVGFSYTEQEDIDGDYDGEGGGSKPCYKIDCPDFDDIRLNVAGLCLQAGLLQARGYPELIARVTRGALVAHDHKLAGSILAAVEAESDPVTMPSLEGAAAPLLTGIELQVEHMRYVNRLADSATIEAVFPRWIRGAIRSDLALRQGVDFLSVPNSRVDAWFRERGIAPQYIYNWQDITGPAGTFTGWPTSVKFLLYPAGTWVRGSSDIITLDTIYDSTLLGTNDFTALFSEEGWLAAKMCHDSRVVTVPICPNGATHIGLEIDCPAGPVTTTTTTAAPTTTTTTTAG